MHRRADRVHAPHIFANAGERLAERRIDDAAHEIEHDRQHAEHVKIIGVAIEVVIEHAEQRREGKPRQAVIAAGNVGAQVAGFLQHDGGGERQHQQRQPAIAQQEPSGDEADERRQQGRRNEARDRFAPAETSGSEPHRIGADAEEGGVAERDDAGITEDQIERQRKQRHDQHLAAEGHALGKGKETGNRDQPRQRLARTETMAAQQKFRGAVAHGDARSILCLTRGHRTPQA